MNSKLSAAVAILLSVTPLVAATTSPAEAEIPKTLRERLASNKAATAIVVGIVDTNGPRVFSCGKLDSKEDSAKADGDTLFEIGSVSKLFTGLLLEQMIERGEMKLDDPIGKYLPKSVTPPSFNGKQITLRHLVTHTAALPRFATNARPVPNGDAFADYTKDKLFAFLNSYELPRAPGTKFEYSNLGVGLLGDLIAWKAGTNYETLLVSRICEPLKMNSTRIGLSPDLKQHLATGHNPRGGAARNFNAPLFVGAGGIISSANDMLKFLAANLGLAANSPLAGTMQKTHEVQFNGGGHRVGMAWHYRGEDIAHNGMTRGYHSMVALDQKDRRGVVVLANSVEPIDDIGWKLLTGSDTVLPRLDETEK